MRPTTPALQSGRGLAPVQRVALPARTSVNLPQHDNPRFGHSCSSASRCLGGGRVLRLSQSDAKRDLLGQTPEAGTRHSYIGRWRWTVTLGASAASPPEQERRAARARRALPIDKREIQAPAVTQARTKAVSTGPRQARTPVVCSPLRTFHHQQE